MQFTTHSRLALRAALLLLAVLLLPRAHATLHPGPDPFGYTSVVDLNGTTFHNFEDISGFGRVAAEVSSNNETNQDVSLPFFFKFYGASYSSCKISDNGLIGFSGFTGGMDSTSTAIPSPAADDNLIAAWWGNLNPSLGGTVYYQALGTAPNRRFIVQYEAVREANTTRQYTFQIKLFETTNVIEIHYKSMAVGGAQYTTGIENSSGNVGLQYFRGTNPSFFTSRAVRFELTTPDIPVTIRHNFNGTVRAIGAPEIHRLGEFNSGASVDAPGLSFAAPSVLYLDRDRNFTSGITGETVYVARQSTGFGYNLTGYGNLTNLDFPFGFVILPATGATGGTFTWYWEVEELPRPTITVKSEFGPERVTPRVGSIQVADNSEQTFNAPEFIYLNRDFQELDVIGGVNDPDPAKVAHYRARNVGYAIDGEAIQGAERFFTQTITRDIKIVWKWELEYAVFIESATHSPPPGTEPDPGVGTGNPAPTIGRTWVTKDTELSAAIDRVVGSDASGFRFESAGYELSNVRGPGFAFPNDFYWKVKDSAQGVLKLFTQAPSQGATIEWWGKVDRKLDSGRDQIFLALWDQENTYTPPLPERAGEGRWRNAMFFGVRADGQFFVEETTPSASQPDGILRELATLPNALVGFDWHHWAVVFDFVDAKREIRIYRDAALVFRNTLPAIDSNGDPLDSSDPSYKPGILEGIYKASALAYSSYNPDPGSNLPGQNEQLEGGLNNIQLFNEVQSRELIASHATGPGPFGGTVFSNRTDGEPVFDNGFRISGMSKEPFPASASANLRVNHRELLDNQAGERVATRTVPVDDWLRIKWEWDGQVRYRFDAIGAAQGENAAQFNGQAYVTVTPSTVTQPGLGDGPWNAGLLSPHPNPFQLSFLQFVQLQVADSSIFETNHSVQVRSVPLAAGGQVDLMRFTVAGVLPNNVLSLRYVDDPTVMVANGSASNGLVVLNQNAQPTTHISNGPNTDLWIDTGSQVTVGAYYRTVDNCFTLADFQGALGGDLSTLGTDLSGFADRFLNNRTARTFTVQRVEAPTEIHWSYVPTVFRAEVPLGQAFDPAKAIANTQLVPDLCNSPASELRQSGPDFNTLNSINEAPGRREGAALRWDEVDRKLYPVHPGTHQIDWLDENSDKAYRLEIVSGYPGTEVKLRSEREKEDGSRIPLFEGGFPELRVVGSGASRQDFVTLPDTGSEFPGSPTAHYHHLFDPVEARRPPTKLDLDPTDEWYFQDLTYTDPDTDGKVDGSQPGTAFSTETVGRSVVLYSFRPNPDEAADGNLAKEKLAVRVVESETRRSLAPEDPKFALGQRALMLGTGPGPEGAHGIVRRDNRSANSFDLDDDFVFSYWLNAKGINPGDSPVTVLRSGNGGLRVTLDPATSTLTVNYRGLEASHPFTPAGPTWRHHLIHVFTDQFFGIEATFINFYLDGVREEQGMISALLPDQSPATSVVADAVTPGSFQFGAGADPRRGLQLDEFAYADFGLSPRPWLRPDQVQVYRESPQNVAKLWFRFEEAPTAGSFRNESTLGSALPDLGLGVVDPDPSGKFADTWAHTALQEVATRLDSTLDNAGFGGGGYILNRVSNYNANLYERDAEVGTWGPIFPVNHNRLFQDALPERRRLEVAYYQNPYLLDSESHPNVAWPYEAAAYDKVEYPVDGPHKDKRIYIASRIGSEGVDDKGRPQQIFDLAEYANLQIYNQPSREGVAGYNPNEEHALVAPSNRAGLKVKELGADLPNNPPLAAFALQEYVNDSTGNDYSSDPWVLVQVDNLATGEPEMAAYRVREQRAGTVSFPRPDEQNLQENPGLTFGDAPLPENRFLNVDPEQSYDFHYSFSYPVAAGDLLIPPYPLNLVIGNIRMPTDPEGNDERQRSLWHDVYDNAWVISGGAKFFYKYLYPFRGDFYLPGTVEPGTPVAWLPGTRTPFIKLRDFTASDPETLKPGRVVYDTFWRSDYPKLKRGETVTYQGGEYFNENPGSKGLPALVAMKAAEIVYDTATPTMVLGNDNVMDYSARIIRPLDRREALFSVADMQAAGFTPASPKIFVVAERWYLQDLAGSLQRRFYFDSLAEKLVFRGFLNDKDGGDADLTSGPDPINILEPNVMTTEEKAVVLSLGEGQSWTTAVDQVYLRSRNPELVRTEVPPDFPTQEEPVDNEVNLFLAGVKESPIVTERIGLNLNLYNAEADLAKESQRLRDTAKRLRDLETTYRIEHRDPRRQDYNNYSVSKDDIDQVRTALDAIDLTPLRRDISKLNHDINKVVTPKVSRFVQLDSLGVGSALVCNPTLLTNPVNGSRYVTIVENNRIELDGAPVSLHVIEIVPDRYRGAIVVIEGSNAFSERITLQHNGDFGANTDDLYYEWWIRDAAPLDVVAEEVRADGTLAEVDERGSSLWQQYVPEPKDPRTPEELAELNITAEQAKHLGLHTIVFEGRPDVTLADKLVLMRYRHRLESNWNLVPFQFTNPAAEWRPFNPNGASFQWAGAANSPQLQADGRKRYIPQLVMGWVKRILDRINPYEARYTDFFSNESPAVYSSQIQIAGAPFAGKVALNPDKNVIENTGLIELYETVLARARELSIDNSSNAVSTDGINQALLLAATRLAVLYELLAREAYSDAQDSTITVTDTDDLSSVASFTHAFQNFEASLLHEELALLRGTDFRKSFPVYNRMFWNYAKGLGEAAYNVNYRIYDENTDGFINEDDARALYPQGHGDAWGHFLSALGMHYTLLQHPVFSWKTRSELYSLMENVLEVDFLDEKTFAKLAAGKARAGRDIVRGTYRLHYTNDPDGQWQGYPDGANPARAWGVGEWATRTGQAAYFDWAVANTLLPEDAGATTPVNDPENLDRIERLGAIDDVGEIAGGLYEIQIAMDEANGGVNPLGFDTDALTFDIDPVLVDGNEQTRKTHFEQVYDRALVAGTNALATLDFAAKAGNKLMRLAGDTDAMIVEALRQDIDYRNRLITIFGRPYDGTIGPGQLFPEGYQGPDTQLFAYLDHNNIDDIIPATDPNAGEGLVTFERLRSGAVNLSDGKNLETLYADVFQNFFFDNLGAAIVTPFGGTLGVGQGELRAAFTTLQNSNTYEDFSGTVEELTVPVRRNSPYAFQAPPEWGQRTSYGTVQRVLEQELRERIALESTVQEYIAFLQDFEVTANRLDNAIRLIEARDLAQAEIGALKLARGIFEKEKILLIQAAEVAEETADETSESIAEGSPTANGIGANDVTSAIRGIALGSGTAAQIVARKAKGAAEYAQVAFNLLSTLQIGELEYDQIQAREIDEVEGLVVDLVGISGREAPLRNAIGTSLQNIELLRQEYVSAQAEGFRLLREREAFNKILAAKAQKNRYQDMIFRIARNEAMTKYQSAFNHAARYAWMATRAYDYETSLDPGDPAAPGALLDQIVKERQLGLWTHGEPRSGQGGLAEILNHLNANFQVLKGQLGLNNPQAENEKISLRSELFRIGPGLAGGGMSGSDERWEDALKARVVPNLGDLPEFRRYCRPFASTGDGDQPGIVIRFATSIELGSNVFGLPLAPGDHSYSTSNFATKVRAFGAWLENYNAAGLSTTPRAYLVPVGNDYLRTSSSEQPITRVFGVQEQRIPTPFVINESDLKSPGFIPTLNGVDGGFSALRRHGDFRMYHDAGGTVDESELILGSRLIGRSVWNSDWLLIIPGAGLHLDPATGLGKLAENVTDIKLHFKTYSHQGQ